MRDRGNEIKSKQTHLTTVFEKSKLLRLKSVQLVCIRILFIEFCTLYNPLVKMENLKLPTVALSYSKKFIRGTFLFFFFSFFFKCIYFFNFILFLAVLCLRCCARAFPGCRERGLLFVVVRRLLIAVASLVAEHRLQAHGLQQLRHMGSVVVARGLQSAGSVVVVHRLSCSTACGIFLDQRSNPCPLRQQADS